MLLNVTRIGISLITSHGDKSCFPMMCCTKKELYFVYLECAAWLFYPGLLLLHATRISKSSLPPSQHPWNVPISTRAGALSLCPVNVLPRAFPAGAFPCRVQMGGRALDPVFQHLSLQVVAD